MHTTWNDFFFSFIPESYKRNLITCLVTRAFRIGSHATIFDIELEFLKDFFLKTDSLLISSTKLFDAL